MTKASTFLLILMLLSGRCFGLRCFVPLFEADSFVFIFLAFLLFSLRFRSRFPHKVRKAYRTGFTLIVGSLLLSFVTLFITYGQTPLHSLWIYREELTAYFSIYALFRISPTAADLRNTFSRYAGLYICLCLVNRVYDIGPKPIREAEGYDALYAWVLPGSIYLIFLMLPQLAALRESFRPKRFALVCLCFFFLFAGQNRTIIFPLVLLMTYTLLRMRSRTPVLTTVTVLTVIGIAVSAWADNFTSLLAETDGNLQAETDNRNLAWAYLSDLSHFSWYEILLGHGIPSTHFSAEYLRLAERGIFMSDVGILGYWYTYGALGALVIVALVIRPLLSRRWPLYLRYIAFFTLIGCVTIFNFSGYLKVSYLAIYLYLHFTEWGDLATSAPTQSCTPNFS